MKYIVFDDDPTGIQTVFDVLVLVDYDYKTLKEAFLDKRNMFYVSTNSRSFLEKETIEYHEKLMDLIIKVAKETNSDFTILSRGDSSLRGHYPLETEIIYKKLMDNGINIDGEIICPYLDGVRKTIDDIHYVVDNGNLIKVGDSEFSKDKTFGFKSSDLKEYVEEKTHGKYKASDCISISLDDLNDESVVVSKLNNVSNFNKVIVNAESMEDLKKFVGAYKRSDKKFIFRCAASLVKEIGNIPDKAYLTKKECITGGRGGLVLVGSHVNKTKTQLEYLRGHFDLDYVEFNQHEVLNNNLSNEAIRCAKEVSKKLNEDKIVLLATRRDRVDFSGEDKEEQLKMAVSISKELTGILNKLEVAPKFLVSKGGITSFDCLNIGLHVKKGVALGQIEKNVGVIKCLEESKFENMPVVIFPGNVGSEETLYSVVNKLGG